ncbi:MAG: hypothetical protein QOJ22_1148 [Thermoleophilaceae bacterium]|nr:hypothetical protein [Thermoleophilaceae bacterium]
MRDKSFERGFDPMRVVLAVFVAAFCSLLAAPMATASPVATNDGSYTALGRVFPDPLANCQNTGGTCSPYAQGNLPATQFIGIDEFVDGVLYMNQRPDWQRYMEVFALDGKIGDGAGNNGAGDVPGNNLGHSEFNPDSKFVSAGLATNDLERKKSDLMVVRVTDETVPDAGKKRYALSLSIHGIERAGAEGGTRAMEDLVTAFTTQRNAEKIVPASVDPKAPTYADVLKKSIVYFTYPNPDGWRRGSVSAGPEGGVFFQRYNGNGVDPNRDWPDIGYAFRGYSAVSEPETRGWISFYNDVREKGGQFAAGDDLHGQPFADALSYTLLPHGRHRYDKNVRIQETAKAINRSTYDRIKWSPIVQANDQPQGGAAGCAPDTPVGTPCSKIYAQTWGSVYDTINYTTTGALGDWFDSSIGLNADGIDNEMSFSHLDKNITFDPHTEQLHVAGNKGLIFARLTELIQPTADTTFSARGRKGYVANRRVTGSGRRNLPEAPPGTRASGPVGGDVPAVPNSATFNFKVPASGGQIHNGGIRVEATNGNISGIGTGSVQLQIQCKGCDRHPGVKGAGDFITVAEDYNQSEVYLQAGVVATVNDPQSIGPDGKAVEWRAVATGPAGVVRFNVVFTNGPASADGDTGGGPAPEQRAYDVANTDFFDDLNDFMPSDEDFRRVSPRAVIDGRQSLDAFDTIALADDPLPGYTGEYGRRTPPGPATADQNISGNSTPPSGGEDSPASFTEKEFTIGANDANAKATIEIKWLSPADDFDLYVYKEEGGRRFLVGESASPPPGTSESVELLSPDAGKYIVAVENFAAANPAWTGSIKFTRRSADTGEYTNAEREEWTRALREWVRGGGNLVLTDGALQALRDLTPLPRQAVNTLRVYAGQSAFATSNSAPTTGDPLARGVVQQGARFNSGFRRQMFEPTPLGYAIQNPAGGNFSASPQWDVDLGRWRDIGGRVVATSVDSDPGNAAAVFTRVTIGELKIGSGQIRIAGALLPQPTEEYDHQFGLEPYAATYTGYTMARNLLDAGRSRGPVGGGIDGERGKNTLGGRFIISKRKVRPRRRGIHRIAHVRVRCRHPRGCRGRLRLKVVKRLRGRGNGRQRGKLRLVQIGQRKFRYRKARKAVVKVRLTLEGRRLNRRNKRLRIRASAPVRFGTRRGGVARRRFVMLQPKRR